jgi:hypothetical protein
MLSGTLACKATIRDRGEDVPYKVYVILGFHASFYHSWRGDTPDEAGFGTDIRLVREIIKMLDQANAEGLQARGYWDFDVYWTLEQIIPTYAPDIIEDIRRRVQSGQDEVLPGPYNNGANHAATEEEFRTVLAYALENPYGSGLKQLFGKVTPIYRPQETMYTAGQNAILAEEGFDGFVIYYSSIPFDSVSPFIPTLPPEQRYNPLWLRSRPDEQPVIVLPTVSPMDLFNYVSLEKWLLDLRQLQTSGRVKSDLVLHLNFDADVETWLPFNLPRAFAWFPNTGGLMEYIKAVNKYPWAEFTVPSEYLKTHPPAGENVQQKLRRLLDLRWIEVAPFQLHPAITALAEKPLRIWKHNYLGVTSSYDLNYGQINPRNKNLDSFNHQVTAGWVAVSNGQHGLLMAESAEALASLAFCPMRLREINGVQHLSLNPFGSYHGKQLDYSHLGGNGVGTELAIAGSSALKPNGPSFNGQSERFSLLLAPYAGDEPPPALQTDAATFFYPFGVIYLKTPSGIEAVVPEDMRRLIADQEREARLMSTAPLPPPTAFLANPSDEAVDLVWDPPRDERVTGYEVRWRKAETGEWQTEKIAPANRWHLPNLENGRSYVFQIRALGQDRESEWTQETTCVPGPVKPASLLSAASSASPWTMLRLIYYGLVHGWTVLRGYVR